MPRLTRSTSLTLALVFGFLSVLTIFGGSSGGLHADTPITPAEVVAPTAPSASNFVMHQPSVAAHGEGNQIPAMDISRLPTPNIRVAQQGVREACFIECRAKYQRCLDTLNTTANNKAHSIELCLRLLASCNSSCNNNRLP